MAEESEEDIIEVPIEWYVPESVQTLHATNIVVQSPGDEFYLSFFETAPPIILGEPEVIAEQKKQLTSVRARCVARIVLTPERMESMINALVQNYTRYLSRATVEGDTSNVEE